MSTFSKHNNLSTSLSNACGLINENSNINIKNSTISSLIPSFVINNGVTNIIDNNNINACSGNIIIDNSKNYIDDLLYNTLNYSYVEKGSLFSYSKVTLSPSTSFFNPTSNNYLLIIPKNDIYKNNKDQYIKENGIENIGTGNLYYSTHFLNNGNYGYWGNKYGGLWIKDNDEISINDIRDLITCIESIPRNLNGYTVNIFYRDIDISNLNINNFYNGTLNIIFLNELKGDINNTTFNINNNNLNLNIEFLGTISNFAFLLNDNKNITFTFNETGNLTFGGNNNYINLDFRDIISNSLSLFNTNSYGNKITISSIENNNLILNEDNDNLSGDTTLIENTINTLSSSNNEILNACLVDNNKMCGNYITILSNNEKIGDLVNDNGEILNDDQLELYLNSFTIDEVHPKKYRDVTDIGTIIGWNDDLPIPRGYYKCDGSKVAVDLNNPQDEFYNGQLAYYLNGSLSCNIIELPKLPTISPSTITTDPYYYNNNFVPQDRTAKLIYIIKYNNNFLNKKKGQ